MNDLSMTGSFPYPCSMGGGGVGVQLGVVGFDSCVKCQLGGRSEKGVEIEVWLHDFSWLIE